MNEPTLSKPVNPLWVLLVAIAYVIVSWAVKTSLFTGLTISLGMFTSFNWETTLIVCVTGVDLFSTIVIIRWGHKTSSALKVTKFQGRWMVRLALIITYLNLGFLISIACILLLMALFTVGGTILSSQIQP